MAGVNWSIGSMGKVRLAIIGGAGPDAGVDMFNKILAENRGVLAENYQTDRDAPHITLFQVPGIGGPRNEKDLVEAGGFPYKLVEDSLFETVDNMRKISIDKFCISCNTLHMLEPMLRNYLARGESRDGTCIESVTGKKIEFVSMIECTKDYLANVAKDRRKRVKVAIFGTLNVTDLERYSPYKVFAQNTSPRSGSIELMSLPIEVRQSVQDLIATIKRIGVGEKEKRLEYAKTLVDLVKKAGAEEHLIVMACTELPLILPTIEEVDPILFPQCVDPASITAKVMLGIGQE